MDTKPNVAFVCVHNSCRSQIAEAFGKEFASDVFVSYSAGTEPGTEINSDSINLLAFFLSQHVRIARIGIWKILRARTMKRFCG